MSSVLVTGANGFIGNMLCRKLLGDGFQVRSAIRSNKSFRLPGGIESCEIADIGARVDWNGIELYLKVVFKGKGGVSTGRLLAAVNRPH